MAPLNHTASSKQAAISHIDEPHISHFDDGLGRASCKLLTLPRELRDMIWTEALVRHRIYVTWTLCENTLQGTHSRVCCRFTRWCEDDWGSVDAIGTYVGLQRPPKDWLSLNLALIKRDDTSLDAVNDQPYLDTLSVCLQAFDEAAIVFYSQNCFVFCAPQNVQLDESESTGVLPAFAFLSDRSSASKFNSFRLVFVYLKNGHILSLSVRTNQTKHSGIYAFRR